MFPCLCLSHPLSVSTRWIFCLFVWLSALLADPVCLSTCVAFSLYLELSALVSVCLYDCLRAHISRPSVCLSVCMIVLCSRLSLSLCCQVGSPRPSDYLICVYPWLFVRINPSLSTLRGKYTHKPTTRQVTHTHSLKETARKTDGWSTHRQIHKRRTLRE